MRCHFHSAIGRLKCARIEASLAAIMSQSEGSRIGGGLAMIPRGYHEIADHSLGINETHFIGPNRGQRYPISGVISRPISGRLKCAENEASLAAIRGQNVGLPDCWRVGRNFPRISLKSRTDRWELMAPDSRSLISARNASFFVDFWRSSIGVEMAPEIGHPQPRLGSRMWVSQIGGGLVAIFPGSSGNHGPIIGN